MFLLFTMPIFPVVPIMSYVFIHFCFLFVAHCIQLSPLFGLGEFPHLCFVFNDVDNLEEPRSFILLNIPGFDLLDSCLIIAFR